MNIFWLGHGGFRMEIGDQVILIDPWLTGNPMLGEAQHDAALAGTTQILITHGHGDHTADLKMVAERTSAPVAGMVELMGWFAGQGVKNTTGFNKGGTITCGDVAVSMVPAAHSSSLSGDNGPIYAGGETGFILKAEGHCIYISGDTEDTPEMRDLTDIDLAFVCMNLPFTMDATAAASAVSDFAPTYVYPYHYRGRDGGTQDPEAFAKRVGTEVEVKMGNWYS